VGVDERKEHRHLHSEGVHIVGKGVEQDEKGTEGGPEKSVTFERLGVRPAETKTKGH